MSKWKEFVEATKAYWTKEGRHDVSKIFPSITTAELKVGDAIIYYYGNWVTEKHGESWRSAKYGYATPCPYHANDFYDHTVTHKIAMLLDTELETTYSSLDHEYMTQLSKRIDVIRPINITPEQQEKIMAYIEEVAAKEPLYGVRRYAGFLKQMPFIVNWTSKFLKPKDSELVCSNRVAQAREVAGIKCSYLDYKDSAPVDLLIYALDHPDEFEIFTLKDKED